MGDDSPCSRDRTTLEPSVGPRWRSLRSALPAATNCSRSHIPVREHAAARGWDVAGEYVDHASAADIRGRTSWGALWDAGGQRSDLGSYRGACESPR